MWDYLDTITAKEFGIRMAKVMNESKSSNAYFWIQEALKDTEGEEMEWTDVQQLLDKIIKEGEENVGLSE